MSIANNGGWKEIKFYHVHVYFAEDKVAVAESVHALVGEMWSQLQLGEMRREPFGPHPLGNFQVLVPVVDFSEFARWMSFNRQGLSVLLHPITPNQVDDHNLYSLWVGPSVSNLDMDYLAKLDSVFQKMGMSDDEIVNSLVQFDPNVVEQVRKYL
ncbi:hypothetical protein AeMF1_021268 [Aphanomyces euteiches]|nr:hypothetical protein AeMF1_021268 [Aphanomyces euteiches]KAH9184647.1 hypothetical protein AeNC1_013375 [Aphanomyces euteiches]